MSLVSVVIYHRCQLLQCQRVFVPLYNVISPPWFCNCWDGKFSHYYVYSVSKLDIFRLAAAALCIIDSARIIGAAAACGGFAAERHAVRRYRSLAGAVLSSTYGQCHDDSWRKGLKTDLSGNYIVRSVRKAMFPFVPISTWRPSWISTLPLKWKHSIVMSVSGVCLSVCLLPRICQ